jgi:hypothetical protein
MAIGFDTECKYIGTSLDLSINKKYVYCYFEPAHGPIIVSILDGDNTIIEKSFTLDETNEIDDFNLNFKFN